MRVAFIVQRCGREVNGGAELLCLQIAQRMSKHWTTEVLTTCAVDYMTWENFYPPDEERIDGTTVRRFLVDRPRDVESFNRRSEEVRTKLPDVPLAEQEEWMRAQGPLSRGLLDYLARHRDDYDAFVFFGYLYATTYFGLPLVEEKAWLAPLAHDEWPIRLTMWDRFFARPRHFIFSTTFERAFLQRRVPQLRLAGPVIGVGISLPHNPDAERFRTRYGMHEPFLLYAGRIDESKGCRWLVENFIRARLSGRMEMKLVLIGMEVMSIPFHDDVIHLGFVEEQEKIDAMAACDWLVMPSQYESLSMVLLEAWAVGRPGVVNAQAEVLIGHCQASNGGLWYHDWAEFEAIVRTVDAPTKTRLGEQGRRYVTTQYTWERVEQDYLRLLSPKEEVTQLE